MINPGHKRLSIVRQCELVSISRASFYRQPAGESEENLELMRLIDEAFLEAPWYGARQMARHLRRLGWCIGRKRVRRLMRKIGLSPIYQAPKTSAPHLPATQDLSLPAAASEDRTTQPGLVRRRDLYPDEARLPLSRRHNGLGEPQGPRLAAVEHLEADFCVAALEEAMARYGSPEIFNTDSKCVLASCSRAA